MSVLRLILTLMLVAVVATFTGFNLQNSCNVWLFHTFENVPVYVTILVSFIAGVLLALPFTLGRKAKRSEEQEKRKEEKEAKKALKASKKNETQENLPVQSTADAVMPQEDNAHEEPLSGESPK